MGGSGSSNNVDHGAEQRRQEAERQARENAQREEAERRRIYQEKIERERREAEEEARRARQEQERRERELQESLARQRRELQEEIATQKRTNQMWLDMAAEKERQANAEYAQQEADYKQKLAIAGDQSRREIEEQRLMAEKRKKQLAEEFETKRLALEADQRRLELELVNHQAKQARMLEDQKHEFKMKAIEHTENLQKKWVLQEKLLRENDAKLQIAYAYDLAKLDEQREKMLADAARKDEQLHEEARRIDEDLNRRSDKHRKDTEAKQREVKADTSKTTKEVQEHIQELNRIHQEIAQKDKALNNISKASKSSNQSAVAKAAQMETTIREKLGSLPGISEQSIKSLAKVLAKCDDKIRLNFQRIADLIVQGSPFVKKYKECHLGCLLQVVLEGLRTNVADTDCEHNSAYEIKYDNLKNIQEIMPKLQLP